LREERHEVLGHAPTAQQANAHEPRLALARTRECRGLPVEKLAQEALDLLRLEQKGIVAMHRADLAIGHVAAQACEEVRAEVHFARRIEIVARDAKHEHAAAHAAESRAEVAAPFADVVQVHRTAEEQIGIGVEALDDALAMETQPRLDVEHPALGQRRPRLLEPVAAKALFEPRARPVAQHADAARDHLAELGDHLVAVDVELDAAALQPVHADLMCGRHERRRDDDDALREVRLFDRPLPGDHSAHRRADDERELLDAERFEKELLHAHHVARRQQRKRTEHRFAIWPREARPGRPVAAPDQVGAEHLVAIRVEHLARTDEIFPEAAGLLRELSGRMRVGRHRMHEQHDVVAGRVALSPGLVADLQLVQLAAHLRREGRGQLDRHDLPQLLGRRVPDQLALVLRGVLVRCFHESLAVPARALRMESSRSSPAERVSRLIRITQG
jgi:hypothetical protein